MNTKMMALALLTLAGTAMAQNSMTNSIAGTFVDITSLAGVNNLLAADADDTVFSFTGTVSNSVFDSTAGVWPNSDGYIEFGGPGQAFATYTNAPIPAGSTSPITATNATALFPYWDDLYAYVGNGADISWIEGPAASFGLPAARGNVLIVQWTNMDHYYTSPNKATFQVQIYSNVVNHVAAQMLYQATDFGSAGYNNGQSATVGFAAGSTGGADAVNNVQYAYNTLGSINPGMVLSVLTPGASISPTVAGAVDNGSAFPGDTVIYTATVTPGSFPTSTGITVRGNLSTVGGGANVLFHDDGLNGDAAAGDGVYSYRYVLPAAQPGGSYSLPVTVTDAQSRSGSGAIVGSVFNPQNLGNLSTADVVVDVTQTNVTPNEVHWYKMHLPAVNAVASGYVDIWASPIDPTNPVSSTDLDDTDLALYDSVSGVLMGYDDLSGPGYFGQLSFGSTNVVRAANAFPGQTAGAAFAGQNGALADGIYYLAVAQYPMAHPSPIPGNWSAVVSTYTGPLTTTAVHIHAVPATAPYPPVVTGVVTPASAEPADTVLFTATVLPGGNPASTGISVHGDLSAIGGSATALFHDDGLAGDVSAGDGIYSFSYVIPAATAGGAYSVALTVTDAQSRSGSGTINGSVFNPEDLGQIGAGAGGTEVVTTHDVTVNAPAEVQWFKFSIGTDVLQASTNYFDIDTEPTADDGAPAIGSINDTEIGLYSPDGTLIANDDDSGSGYHSQLSFGDNTNVRPAFGNGTEGNGRNGDLMAGTYYLAGGLFNVTFAANFVVTDTSATGSGVYQLNFRTNIPGGGAGNVCGPADIGSTGGVAGPDNHLDNNDFIVYIDNFFNHLASADIGTTGGVPGSDGAWDNNDFIVFIDQFFNAPASCR